MTTRTAGLPTDALPRLTDEERSRYGRHLVLPEVGPAGQRRLKAARVLLVGAGGLGSPAALYLAAAGVGHLGLVEFDVVDRANLQRQVLYGTGDVGLPKVEAARRRLAGLNPNVEVEAHPVRLDAANALALVRDHDLVVDGTDNFAARYLVNDACVLAGRPNVYGSVFRFEGQASVFAAVDGPCYRCLYPEPPPPGLVPSCAEGGVLGVLPGLVGLVQASEALKLLLGAGEPLVGRLLLVDALHMRFREMRLRRDPDCPACGRRTIREPGEGVAACALVPPAAVPSGATTEPGGPGAPGEGATEAAPGAVAELRPRELAARLRAGDPIDLVDVREAHELALGRMPGARLAPLSTFDEALGTFTGDRDVVLVCQHGIRSVTAARWLQAAGHRRVWSLAGGLERWELEVEVDGEEALG